MIVDLTDDAVHEFGGSSRAGDTTNNQFRVGGAQPKVLGPAAAAALQASSKRKLPESFQKPPVPKRKPAAAEPRPVSCSAAELQAPSATRIAAAVPASTAREAHQLQRPEQKQQAAAKVIDSQSQPALLPAVNQAGSSQTSSDVADLTLLQPATQQSKAPRRLPVSLATAASVPSDTKSAVARNPSAITANKTGPSEHDTKVSIGPHAEQCFIT